MNYKFGVYGDSIAFGYCNNNQSWFDEIYLENEALKLAQNGEKIKDDIAVNQTVIIKKGKNKFLIVKVKYDLFVMQL